MRYKASLRVGFPDGNVATIMYQSVNADIRRENSGNVLVSLEIKGRFLAFEIASNSLSKLRGFLGTFLRLVKVSLKTMSSLRSR